MDFDVTEQVRIMADQPAPAGPAPESGRSAWGAPWRAVVGGAAQAAGSMADVLKAYGAASAMGLEADPAARAAVGERAAREGAAEGRRQIESGEALTSEGFGRSFRNVERGLRPDPVTASTAEQIVYGVVKPVSKLVAGGLVAGPFGLAGAAAEEGFSQADDLRERGVDLATRTKVGALTAGATAVGAMLPLAGPTLRATAGLYLAGGPGAYIAQQAATSAILENAGYAQIAEEHDPLDPVGLALAALIPLPFAAVGAARNVRVARAGRQPAAVPGTAGAEPAAVPPEAAPHAPQETVDAAMVQNLTAQLDAHESVAPAAMLRLLQEQSDGSVPSGRVWQDPTGSAVDPLALIQPDDIDAAALARGGWQGLGEAEVMGQGAGPVRFVWRQGEESGKAPEYRVTREDVRAAPAVVREFEPVVGLDRDGNIFQEWRVQRAGPDGAVRQVVYVDAPREAGGRVVSMYVQEPGTPGAEAPLSARRSDRANAAPADETSSVLQLDGRPEGGRDAARQEQMAYVRRQADELVKKTPDLPMRVDDAAETRVGAGAELENARRLAAEGTDTDLGTLDADLVRVAAECALRST